MNVVCWSRNLFSDRLVFDHGLRSDFFGGRRIDAIEDSFKEASMKEDLTQRGFPSLLRDEVSKLVFGKRCHSLLLRKGHHAVKIVRRVGGRGGVAGRLGRGGKLDAGGHCDAAGCDYKRFVQMWIED